MQSYVVGFAFSKDMEQILLIEKLRPTWQEGCLNGIGGKIEKDELPLDAMHRECMEESGLELDWVCRGVMSGINGDKKPFECHIFYAYDDAIWDFKQKEDEPLSIYYAKELHDKKMIKNLRFLIPFGQSDDTKEFMQLEY